MSAASIAYQEPAAAPAFVDPGGVTLRDALPAGALALPEVLDIGLQLARSLADVHRLGVSHRHINPSNIVIEAPGLTSVRPEGPSRQARLIGFGPASTLADQQRADAQLEMAGSLAYLAPEQTGRTGRSVDQRADLYGLGATLYELVTGRAPFEDSDPLQLIHKVLAQPPARPSGIPCALSDIVMRLLEKEPGRRYQSAAGLAHDLARLRDRLAAGELGAFVLGEHDFAARLPPPSRPIGRDAEIAVLTATFADAVQGQGHTRGVLVAGVSGVGKTMLINELRPLATARRGWFVMGTFDPHRQDLASDAVYQAFRALGKLLLAEPEAELVVLRERMRLALGPNAGLIAALQPEFALLLGIDPRAQPPSATEEDPLQAERRLLQAAVDLLRGIASPQRPLVIALDDLQWAAALPLAFIDAVLTGDHLPGVLLVGACRTTEVDTAHPLTALRARWERLGVTLVRVALGNLPPADLGTLVGTMLRLAPAQAAPLAETLAERSAGNPFDTIELINALRHDGALLYGDGGWHWNAATIRRHIGSGNVVDLLSARIERLPHDTRAVLATLACLGGEVGLGLLCTASDVTPETLEACVVPALDDGLLVPDPVGEGALRFCQPRVQQVAWERMGPAGRQALQLSLARRLAPHHEFAAVAAEQYLGALEAVQDAPERRQVAQLFHRVATQARHTNGVLAERLLVGAIGLLAALNDAPDAASKAALAVDRHAVLYSLGRLEEADAVYASMAFDPADPVQNSAIACIQVSSLSSSGRPKDAIALGLQWLAALGIAPLRGADFPADLSRRMEGLCRWIDESSDAQDLQRPPLRDARIIAAARLISRMLPAAFTCDRAMMAWIGLESVRLWVEHGPCAPLVANLGGIPAITVALRGDYRTGYLVARRALQRGEALGCELETTQVRMTLALLASHWFEPLEETKAQARLAFEALVRGGDLQFATIAQLALVRLQLDCGPTLSAVRSAVDAAIAFAERTGDTHFGLCLPPYRELTRVLSGETGAQGADPTVDDQAAQAPGLASNPAAMAQHHLMHALSAALFGDADRLSLHATAAMALLPALLATYASAFTYLLQALALADRVKSAAAADRGALLAEFDACADWLRGRAADAPVNFSHLVKWVEAERAWACGEHYEATLAFDAALREGAKRERPWHNALMTERAALFHLGQGLEHTGRELLSEARDLYAAWGATAKVQQLDRRHAFLKTRSARRAGAGDARQSVSPDAIDMLGIVRASQALSSETSLERLRQRVVELLAEMTGATSVLIVLWDDDMQQWLLPQAAPNDGGSGSGPTLAEAAAQGLLPLSVFRYAERTREPLLVEDATRDDRFAGDAYLGSVEHCSLLVVPILHHGAARAMLLLENRLSSGAFTVDRLDAVMLITGQLAVSLANAQLYEQLEQRVRERTRELQEAQAQLLAAARLAGMAEIATNVLHNVGNVLNSVNVSTGLIGARLRSSKVKGLARAVQMMDQHAGDLGTFLMHDAKGKLLPSYLRELAPALEAEHEAMAAELGVLGESVDHIKEVVATQQSYAGAPRLVEMVVFSDLLDDALRMNAGALTRHHVDVVKRLDELPEMPLDRHRLLQILVNLIGNAKQAMRADEPHPCITLSAALTPHADGRVLRITVADNGEGIPPENLTRVFAHGFTTRKTGHGFGLHSCVLAAQEMGGSLTAHSDGSGHGAAFILDVPVDTPESKP